jgi:hypothetical protein
VITVGGTFSHTTAGGYSLDSTQAGAASSYKFTASTGGLSGITYNVFYIAVGASAPFSRIYFSGRTPGGKSYQTHSSCPGYFYPEAGTALVQATAGIDSSEIAKNWAEPSTQWVIQDGSSSLVTLSTVTGMSVGQRTDTSGNWYSDYVYVNDFAQNGYIQFSAATTIKGWPSTGACAAALCGPTPSGVTAADYYWMIFKQMSYAPQCSTSPLPSCGSTCGGGTYDYSTGDRLSEFSISASGVE